jgi:hypothetical protein
MRKMLWDFSVLAALVTFLVGATSVAIEGSTVGFAATGVGGLTLCAMWLLRREETKDSLWMLFAGIVSRITRFAWYRDRDRQ